jgi:hypothetical protein
VASAATPGAQPRAISELLDATFSLYRRNFQVLAGVAVLIVIPGLVISLISGSYRANPFTVLQQVVSNTNNPAALQQLNQTQQNVINSPLYPLSFLLEFLIIPFSVGALYQAAVMLAMGRPATIGSVLSATLRRYFALFGLIFLIGLVVVGGILIITIPVVIWVVIRWSVATPALFAEELGPARALGRSWQLVSGEWWRTLGILLVVGIMTSVIQSVLGLLFGGLAAVLPGLDSDLHAALSTSATQLVSAVVTPLLPIAVTLLYFDMRVRKEGYDLDELARRAAQGPATA